MMTEVQDVGAFEKNLRKALEQTIVDIVNEEAQEAARRVEKRVRENAASIASTILTHFSMEPYGKKLRIIVDFENTRAK